MMAGRFTKPLPKAITSIMIASKFLKSFRKLARKSAQLLLCNFTHYAQSIPTGGDSWKPHALRFLEYEVASYITERNIQMEHKNLVLLFTVPSCGYVPLRYPYISHAVHPVIRRGLSLK